MLGGTMMFLNPWILAALAAIPVLWFLLRVTPPAPRRIDFPAARFLEGLTAHQKTPSHTPWWILLLRCLIAALVIIGLARPVLHPAESLPSRDPVRIIMENGWASAPLWTTQLRAAEELVASAGREDREIYLATTAPEVADHRPRLEGPYSESQALATLRGMKPLPWSSDFGKLLKAIQEKRFQNSVYTYWLGSGLDDKNTQNLARELQSQGSLTYTGPSAQDLPLLLRPSKKSGKKIAAVIDVPLPGTPERVASVQLLANDGRLLDRQTADINPENLPSEVAFDTAQTLRNVAARVEISGQKSAGSVLLLDESSQHRTIGIVSTRTEQDSTPLIDADYYLTRALEPFSDLHLGPAETLIEKNASMIILPDIGTMTPSTLNALEDWTRKGGLLLRFAGPAMSQAETHLTPVPLRKGERSLEGDLTWEKPQTLAPFPANSPFNSLTIRDTITVRRQVLAEPSSDVHEKTWATLQDGTPLITAAPLDEGTIVLIHTTATPDWSDLALSGLYVDILRRLASLSSGTQRPSSFTGALQPVAVLDGFGALISSQGTQPIPAEQFDTLIPSSANPPGLYTQGGIVRAFNLGQNLPALKTLHALPQGVVMKTFETSYETNLMPYFLAAAFGLFLFDWLLILAMTMAFTLPFRRAGFTAFLLVLLISLPASADEKSNIKHAGGLYLAYVKTGDASLDSLSEKGLEALSDVLRQRTSVEPAGTAAVDPETDDLAFYPFIYWPLTDRPHMLSDTALQSIQYYLDHGGTVLFDTRDQRYTLDGIASGAGSTRNTDSLRQMIGTLNIPPLLVIPEDHVLTKSFYLLQEFPGKYTGGTLWVEEKTSSGRDGVSSVIIGSHDWASAWAAGYDGNTSTYLEGGTRQQELAFRFGVNLVVYTLTGNYKDDQVHLPFILERLGQ